MNMYGSSGRIVPSALDAVSSQDQLLLWLGSGPTSQWIGDWLSSRTGLEASECEDPLVSWLSDPECDEFIVQTLKHYMNYRFQ
jgi:hypothetical protein